MAAAAWRHAADVLRRGLMLLGVMAVVAGFLGMHIMNGMHVMTADGAHAVHPDTAASVVPAPSETVGHELAGGHPADGPSASCLCQAHCTDPASMHSACVPSAAVSSLAAPPPGTAPASLQTPDARGSGAVRPHTYLPAGPSPGELSISRT